MLFALEQKKPTDHTEHLQNVCFRGGLKNKILTHKNSLA